jgi:hypothetical protein
MGRYYFNVRSSDELLEDDEGQSFPSVDEALAYAIRAAREIMSGRVAAGKQPNHRTFEIMDEDGRLVLSFPFLDALGPD